MAPHTSTVTKAGSGRVSRATSLARDIVKRRDKPYKTEQQTVFAKKRKLDLHTSHHKAPRGYAFLPVGTPELAERCKELSRQRGFPVNVVNAKPINRNAENPDKLSHHVHRIGYHFKHEVIEEACQQLGYVAQGRKYVKVSDLVARKQHADLAQTLARYGVTNYSLPSKQRESPEEVRAAIKELFPKIPDKDLSQIVEHAWEEGTDRVGNMKDLSLSRRVQLATIARIRHTYTDYDRLLRAFEWREARAEVEPECLKKLIEWRGENDAEDDEGLEEIVRETIVIDDDDDVANDASEADDEDSGNVSDTSIEITHHSINLDDFAAESTDEKARSYAQRVHPRRRNLQQRNNIAKQKIDATKQRLRNAGFSASKPISIDVDHARSVQPAVSAHTTPHTPVYLSEDIRPKPDQYGRLPEQVIGPDGHVYRLVNPAPPPQHRFEPYRLPVQGDWYQALQSSGYIASPQSAVHPRRFDEHSAPTYERQHVVTSIERDEYGRMPSSANAHKPITPESGSSLKHHTDRPATYGLPPRTSDNYRPAYDVHPHPVQTNRPQQLIPQVVEVMDLSTPEPRQVEVMDLTSPLARRHDGSPHAARNATTHAFHPLRPVAQQDQYAPAGTPHYASRAPQDSLTASEPIPYDPARPMLPATLQPSQARLPTTQIQYTQPPDYRYVQPATQSYQHSQTAYPSQPPQQPRAVHQVPYELPRPVHGAPAPIQWAPIAASAASYAPAVSSINATHQYVPTNGAVAPTQYHYPG